MDTVIKICGICVCALCASLMIKDTHRATGVLCVTAAVTAVMIFCISGPFREAAEALNSLYSDTYFSEYAPTLAKALGIAYITSLGAELCKASGEASLAYAVGIGGRIELVLLCLPLITKLLLLAGDMLEGM